MLYIIYKTTNIINDHFYIGKHQCENLNDGYLGSGIKLKQAIKKYGRENFKREILFIFDNEVEMNNKEKELITETLVKDPMCYNLTIGGEGGPIFLGRHHSNETKQLLRENHKEVKLTDAQIKKSIEKSRKTRMEKYGSWNPPSATKEKSKEKTRKKSLLTEEEKMQRMIEANKRRSETLKAKNMHLTAEQKQHLSTLNKGKAPSNKGHICITKDGKNKYISINDLALYETDGWKRGTATNYNK